MAGPVWVSTAEILREAGFKLSSTADSGCTASTTMNWDRPLNLGWLMIEKPGKAAVEPPTGISNRNEWNALANRIVIVSDRLFTQVVNSNLEVRTSVSIDPKTGAAEEGALFTYEAIPRAALLWMDLVIDDYRSEFNSITRQYDRVKGDNQGVELGASWNTVADVISAGLDLAEHLGIGGMGTRGFGRIRRIGQWQAYPAKEAIKSDSAREAVK
jgi:CRISPR-associated protein Cmr4